VNVWAPEGDAPVGGRAVLLWFAGGAFLTGGSCIETYDGARLAADHDVVVVSANYRLGALGFLWLDDLGGAELGAETNCGLRDLLAAIAWVRANIGTFGGDPANVTLFGESAGAGALLHLLSSPAAQGATRRVILQSPGVDHTLRPADAVRVTDIFLGHLGLKADDIGQLWDLPVETILDAQERTVLETLMTISSMPFHPTLDGGFLPATPSVAFEAGSAADVDLLVSWTADEMRLYPNPVADAASVDDLVRWTQHYLTGRLGRDPGRERAADLARPDAGRPVLLERRGARGRMGPRGVPRHRPPV
jgi:para-nitrobenzyl esterase